MLEHYFIKPSTIDKIRGSQLDVNKWKRRIRGKPNPTR